MSDLCPKNNKPCPGKFDWTGAIVDCEACTLPEIVAIDVQDNGFVSLCNNGKVRWNKNE
jgi:hypothetical protein